MTVRQKMPKSDFQSEFSLSRIIRILLIFFINEEYIIGAHYLKNIFLITSIYERIYFLNSCLIFRQTVVHLIQYLPFLTHH